ncbi:glycosyltransferase family 4 protein [Intrasporangium flavum]|uniref:glycosyltransferase family 4 protein n=1 Tax=Intrasporangium flavum TaxID=1428657 RepID=UPI00096D3021|nr:glycosyltransferase family 4 protein [Intrasporangium flavum]
MRVLHVVRSDAFAGVESHVARLARAQADRGDEVLVVGGDPGRTAAAAGPRVRHEPARTVTDVARRTRQAAGGADVVHAHMTAAEVAAAAALAGRAVPLVATQHFARPAGSNAVSALAADLAGRRVRARISISEHVARSIGRPSTVIHPGVEPVDASPTAAEREPVVLVAQRFEREKETDVAVRAFAASGLAALGWRLHLAGDGSDRTAVEALVGTLGLSEATTFLGHRDDVERLMLRASVLLAPCRVEGLGLTVLEAMAAALPVVAVAGGGHLETSGAVAGAALHAPGDADTAATLLRALADDPDGRDRYGAALQAAQRSSFTPERQAELTDRLYEAVL